jgi:uncharacterized protein YcfJ
MFLSELKIMTHFVFARLPSAVLASALLSGLVFGLPAQAQEVGNVISRTAVYQQVSVPRQVCTQTQINVPGQTSGAGAAMGAIAGGAIGNAIGKGEGRAIATMFAGKQYNVQLPKDPGPTIKLQITPVL